MKHLFFSCAAGGGSSLIKYIIEQCKGVVSFDTEGDKAWDDNCGPGRLYFQRQKPSWLVPDLLANNQHYNWPRIKMRWNNLWKKNNDNRIYMQKSTDDYGRWNIMVEQFDDVHFIIMPRNPFAHIEGMMRKCTWAISAREMAQGWLNIFERQLDCYDNYNKSTLFTFEQLCFEESVVEDKIKNLMYPYLQDVCIKDVMFKHNHRDDVSPSYYGIAFNVGSINRLSLRDIYEIKKVLEPHQDKLERVGYAISSFGNA